MRIIDEQGNRLYLNATEREAFLRAAEKERREVRAMCLLMHDTGIRESEVMEITPARLDIDARTVTIRTLKKRGGAVVHRTIPVRQTTMETLNLVFAVREAQRKGLPDCNAPLWPITRMTVYRHVMQVMIAAGIPPGPQRTPKGLRHGFGVHAIASKVPLNILQRWMGHTSMETTAIYATPVGQEEYGIAEWMWR